MVPDSKDCGELRTFALDELLSFDGTNDSPIYIALNGNVYDVTSHESGRELYSGPYKMMAGRDASVMLAKMDTKLGFDHGITIKDLNDSERSILADWEKKYQAKYKVVGKLV
eukprot:18581_1